MFTFQTKSARVDYQQNVAYLKAKSRNGYFLLAIVGLVISPAAFCQSYGIVAQYMMTQSQPIGEDNSIERSVLG